MKFLSFLSRGALAATLLGAYCATAAEDDSAAPASPEPLRVVATIFPAWDWAREVVGDEPGVELTLLLDDGVDLHSYQPTAHDLKTIAESDLFIHVGGESDEWVASALAAAPNPRRRVLDLLSSLGDAAKTEVLVEGMEHAHHHDHGEAHEDHEAEENHDAEEHEHEHEHEDHNHEEEAELDEHVWLSLRHAQTLVTAIAEALASLDGAHADAYRARAAAYRGQLASLDRDYAAVVAAAPRKTLVVADRFPLRYLADDYGLAYFAAFSGCSAESEASFRTVLFLAGKADELAARSLLVLEGREHRIAESVRSAAKTKPLDLAIFDSMQSTTAQQAAAGATYLGTMRRNLSALSDALR